MQYKSIVRFGVIVVVLMILVMPALAQQCDDIIYDETGRISDIGALERTAQALATQTGGIVRIRLWERSGRHSTLTPYIQEIRKQCLSWQNPANTDLATNLIVISVSLSNRQMSVIAGGDYADVANQHHLDIEQDLMGPELRSGNFDGAFTSAMRAFGRLVEVYRGPTATAPSAQTQPRVVERERIIEQREPTDLSGLWSVLKWVLLIIVMVFVGRFVLMWLRRRERRRAAQQGALRAQSQAARLINELPRQLKVVQSKVAVLSSQVAPEDLDGPMKRLKQAEHTVNASSHNFADIAETGLRDPTRNNLSVSEYEGMESDFTGLYTELSAGRELITATENELKELSELANNSFGTKSNPA